MQEIPDGEEVFLQNPVSLVVEDQGNVNILDQHRPRLFRFDSDGNLQQSLGRDGAGPEEFDMPDYFAWDPVRNKFVIIDAGNRRFQIVDIDNGSWQPEILDQQVPRNYVARDGKIYAFQADHFAPADDLPLITVSDYSGEITDQFGEMLQYYDNNPAALSEVFIEWYEDHIYVLFRRFPMVRKYTLDGELVREMHLEVEDYEETSAHNRNPGNYQEGGGLWTLQLFRGFSVNDDGIFVTLTTQDNIGDGDIIFDHFDFNGQHRSRFINNAEIEFISDSAVRLIDGELHFYVLHRSLENGLLVLQP